MKEQLFSQVHAALASEVRRTCPKAQDCGFEQITMFEAPLGGDDSGEDFILEPIMECVTNKGCGMTEESLILMTKLAVCKTIKAMNVGDRLEYIPDDNLS